MRKILSASADGVNICAVTAFVLADAAWTEGAMKQRTREPAPRSVVWIVPKATAVGLSVAAGLWLFSATAAAADPYPWCAQYGRDGGRNCGFLTLQQCLDTVSGIGGGCEHNLFYTGPERTQDRKPRKQRDRKQQPKR
jgi:hypothetical protein